MVRAAWDRWDTWRNTPHVHPDGVMEYRRVYVEDPLIDAWFGRPRMPAVEDTGSIVATPEDLAEIGPADPVRMPGQRRGRHARPKGET